MAENDSLIEGAIGYLSEGRGVLLMLDYERTWVKIATLNRQEGDVLVYRTDPGQASYACLASSLKGVGVVDEGGS